MTVASLNTCNTTHAFLFRCKLLDFHNPSGPQGTHTKLFEWVKQYYEKPGVFKPPLYLQHQGKTYTKDLTP